MLDPRDTYVMPRGVDPCPEATPGTQIMMFEPHDTPSTGDRGPVDGLNSTTGIIVEECQGDLTPSDPISDYRADRR